MKLTFLFSPNIAMINDNTFTIGIIRASSSINPELDLYDFYPIENTYSGETFVKHLALAEEECDLLFIFSNHYGVLPLGYKTLPVAEPYENDVILAQSAQYQSHTELKKHICSFYDNADSSEVNFLFNLYGDFPYSFREVIKQKK